MQGRLSGLAMATARAGTRQRIAGRAADCGLLSLCWP